MYTALYSIFLNKKKSIAKQANFLIQNKEEKSNISLYSFPECRHVVLVWIVDPYFPRIDKFADLKK